jgi:hypothetical protein
MYISWQNTINFYKYYCHNNKDFLNRIAEIPLGGLDDCSLPRKDAVLNKDIIESTSQMTELEKLYKNNKLVTTRLGCIESSFLMKYLFNFSLPTHLQVKDDIDQDMRRHAGLYYSDPSLKKEICDWWCDETKELVLESTPTSCYFILHFDIALWALLNLKGKFYNYGIIYQILLEHSEGRKILYIGNGVDSIRKGYDRGLQNAWNFPVSNFSMYYLKCPQTTEGCHYPHKSIRETCHFLLKEIEENYKDFDTAIFGCGAYGPPLINALRKKYSDKNLIYLGSDCFKMFGVYSAGMPYQHLVDAKHENWIEVVEPLPEGCENHPEPKYWKH